MESSSKHEFNSSTISKRLLRDSVDLEQQIYNWIEDILSIKLDKNIPLQKHLQSGVLLCNCINTIFPDKIKRIETKKKLAFHQLENISKFLKASQDLGLPQSQIFTTIDLYEGRDMKQVYSTISELSALISSIIPDYKGPVIVRGSGSSPAIKRKVIIKTQRAPDSPLFRRYSSSSKTSKQSSSSSLLIDKSKLVSSNIPNIQFDKRLSGAAITWINSILEWNEKGDCDIINDIDISTVDLISSDEFYNELKDGIKLCHCINKLANSTIIHTIHENVGRNVYKHRENIDLYLAACQDLGIPQANCFSTTDLIENKNLSLVVSNIHSLSNQIRKGIQESKLKWNGPLIEPLKKGSQSTSISILERMESDNAVSIHQNPFNNKDKTNTCEINNIHDNTEYNKHENISVDKELEISNQNNIECNVIDNTIEHEDIEVKEDEDKKENNGNSSISKEIEDKHESISHVDKELKTSNQSNTIENEDNKVIEDNKENIIENIKVEDKEDFEIESCITNNTTNQVPEIETKEQIISGNEVNTNECNKDDIQECSTNTVKEIDNTSENISTLIDSNVEEKNTNDSKVLLEENITEKEFPKEITNKIDSDIPIVEELPNIITNIQQSNKNNNESSPQLQQQNSWGWFSSVFSSNTENTRPPNSPNNTSQINEQEGSIKSFFGSIWQGTSSAISEIITPPTERTIDSPPKVVKTYTPVRGKLRGYQASFDHYMGSIRLQALEMLSEEMKERIDEYKDVDNIINDIITIMNNNPIIECSTPYLSDKAIINTKELRYYQDKCKEAITKLKGIFGSEKTNSKNVVVHTNNSLNTTHEACQNILSELASLTIEIIMRTGESFLIEPYLPLEETNNIIIPKNITKHQHQAQYSIYLLQKIQKEAEDIVDTFINFTYRVGTAGKVRVVRCCNDNDVDQFGKAIDAMTSVSVSKINQDLQSTIKYIENCKCLLQPVINYLYISSIKDSNK